MRSGERAGVRTGTQTETPSDEFPDPYSLESEDARRERKMWGGLLARCLDPSDGIAEIGLLGRRGNMGWLVRARSQGALT